MFVSVEFEDGDFYLNVKNDMCSMYIFSIKIFLFLSDMDFVWKLLFLIS